MINLDLIKQKKTEILQRMAAAVKDDNAEAYSDAFDELMEVVKDGVLAEANGLIQSNDQVILAGRGVRALTSKETEFYQKFISAAKSDNPKQALSGTDNVMPKTIIDSVMEDIAEAHPLLDAIGFQNTAALTEILVSTTSGTAVWGELTGEITGELGASFTKIELAKKKLTAFMLVAKAMLDLGPEWLDRYVRAVLVEANAVGLEEAIVDGDGNDKPLGMTRALTGAVDGVYPRKTAITITDIDPVTYGSILNILSQGPNGKRRAITSIIVVVNPTDYFTKIFPATTVRKSDGGFNFDVFPFPTTVFQSAAVPAGNAIFGLPKRYFAGLGTGKGGKLEYDDSVKFFEDQRAYAIKLYGDGRPLDANSFVVADITGLVPYVKKVLIVNDESEESIPVSVSDARLANLTIGSLTLSPTFNKSVHVYTASTSNSTNTITAVAMDGEAEISILVGSTPVVNGAAATWASGANVVTIEVEIGGETETYTVTVTKS